MSSDKKNETRRVKTADLKKQGRSKKSKKVKFKDKHPKISLTIKITIIVLLLVLIIGSGVLVGTFFGVFGEELKISEDMLVVGYENSTVYDADGNKIATLSGGTKRKSISLSDMSEYLPKAYVAIEDERFYTHTGIDIGRTAYATITYVLHGGKSSFGGSTITQQVIKNITKEKDNTAFAGALRKIKEISKAIQVERYLSKDQILELYLNLIFTAGNDINGVELGAIYYFDKPAKELTIAECAYMAGINHSPNAYKPFEEYADKADPAAEKQKMKEKINTRTKTVLGKMKELAYITEDQYNEAVAEVDNGLPFKNGEGASVTTDISYVVEAAIDQIKEQILAENAGNEDMDETMAEMYLYSSGLHIYTTQKTEIQNVLEEEIVKENYITSYEEKNEETGEKEKFYSLPTMTIIDHKTGQVVAAATAVGSKEERSAITKLGYFNYPTKDTKQTGSSMKPLSVIAPGLECGKITGATVFYDAQTVWGSGPKPYTPKNYDGYSNSLINMRTAIKLSKNVPHVKALSVIGPEVAADFCESVGLPRFDEEGLSLALGGLQHGVSTFQMASAYGAIANGGVYVTPTFYTKVTDKNGNILFEPKQESREVMSKQNAYIEQSILTEPVVGAGGTASYCAIKGMDVAAKTGTTNNDNDRWLCGFTPYYTAATWYGYKSSHTVRYSGNPAGKIWDAVMTKIHENLPNAKFEEPEGIKRATVCNASGKLATGNCGDVHQELFTDANMPKESCEGHGVISICLDSGLLSAGLCPNVATTYQYLPEYEKNAVWHTIGLENATGGGGVIPTEYCPIHGGPGGGESYVTPEDQVKFQAATDAAALGLFGTDADNYINQKLNEWRSSQGVSQAQSQPHQHTPGETRIAVQPTATTPGVKQIVCSTCGQVYSSETIPATGPAPTPTPTPTPTPDPTPTNTTPTTPTTPDPTPTNTTPTTPTTPDPAPTNSTTP